MLGCLACCVRPLRACIASQSPTGINDGMNTASTVNEASNNGENVLTAANNVECFLIYPTVPACEVCCFAL